MWWILIVGVVAVAAWFFFRTNKPERSQPPEKTLKELVAAPEVEAPPVTPSRSADAEPSQADSITIGKNLPLPLTLSGMSPADAKRLAKGLESNNWNTRGWLTLLVARNNVRCEEIDAWVAGARPKLEMAINKGVAASAEWATASELDRADILEEITQEAVEALEVRPSDVDDARTLLKDEPADVTADDALLERFSGNTEAYIKLLSLLGSPGRVWQSAAGQYDRKEFETLVEMGFVRRGADIPIEDILPMLTLAQMQKVCRRRRAKEVHSEGRRYRHAQSAPRPSAAPFGHGLLQRIVPAQAPGRLGRPRCDSVLRARHGGSRPNLENLDGREDCYGPGCRGQRVSA